MRCTITKAFITNKIQPKGQRDTMIFTARVHNVLMQMTTYDELRRLTQWIRQHERIKEAIAHMR